MADTKLTGLTADATPTTDDLVYVVNDPGGTPVSRKVTLANLRTTLSPSGTYTPTATAGTNLTTATGIKGIYSRSGDTVTLTARIDCDPVAAGACDFLLDLPIASNFGSSDAYGIFTSTVSTETGYVISDAASDNLKVFFTAIGTTSHQCFITACYRIV